MDLNITAAWLGFLAGGIAGAVPGLFFHSEDWLGGYGAWPRRMVRLAHISFFGIGGLNLAFGLTARAFSMETGLAPPSGLLVAGAVAMPIVCYLSAYRMFFRNLFFIPALSILSGIALFIWRIAEL